MNQERREKAIAWLNDEIRSLELAPELNGCPMTPEWAAQLEIMRTCLEAVQDHFPDTTKMVKLTLEQLREMDGKQVLYKRSNQWFTVELNHPDFRECIINAAGFFIPLKTAAERGAYAYHPAHIDREAWEPCDQCKSCESCYKLHSFHCYDCKEMSEFVPDSSFCGKCGRPRTLEAWKQMEKRFVVNP